MTDKITAAQWEAWLREEFFVIDEDNLPWLAKAMADVAGLTRDMALDILVNRLHNGVGPDTPDFALTAHYSISA